jgi:hypothetical protein
MKQPVTEDVTRFETEPGFQMQVDFTIIRLGQNPLLAFVATLGWSRATFVKFYSNQDSAAWCDGIESALRFFGGTPHQLLFDNAKAIIIERDVYGPGKHRWNPQLMHVAEKYAFTPKVCRPYRARTKGKVERFNHYLKNSFIVPLTATFRQAGLVLDVPAANARIGEWLVTVANTRVHGTTGVPPEQRMPRERAALLPLTEGDVGIACSCPSAQPASGADREPATSSGNVPGLARGVGMNLQHDRIAALCEQLKLDRLPAEWPSVAQTTIDNSGTHADFLEAVLQLQHDGQNERRRRTILRLSGLPVVKTLEQFDYAYASGVPRSQIQELARRTWRRPLAIKPRCRV